jgi:hypothetical protein
MDTTVPLSGRWRVSAAVSRRADRHPLPVIQRAEPTARAGRRGVRRDGPLLIELDPDRIYFNLPLAEPGQPDPMTEDLHALGERAHAVREQLSMLAAWWPTSEGADLAQRLELALLNIVTRDGWLVHDARRNRDTEPALKAARNDHQQARSLANNLRAEVRGQAAPARSSPRVGYAVLCYGQAR